LLIDAVSEPRAPLSGPKLVKEGDRYHSYGVNLNHNMLTGALQTLPDFIRATLVDPNALSILYISFNVFTEIPLVRKLFFNDIYIRIDVLMLVGNFLFFPTGLFFFVISGSDTVSCSYMFLFS
jgi:hypothetical protein